MQIHNVQADKAEYLDIEMQTYNLIECSDNYAKASGSLSQYQKDIPNDSKAISESFKFKSKTTGRNHADGNTKNGEIVKPLIYFSNFSRIFGIPLINCKTKLSAKLVRKL